MAEMPEMPKVLEVLKMEGVLNVINGTHVWDGCSTWAAHEEVLAAQQKGARPLRWRSCSAQPCAT